MLVVIGIALGLLLFPLTMAQNEAELQVLQGGGQFTTNMYKILAVKGGNVFFSPISIHTVLSMVHQGAEGTTSAQLSAALNVPDARTAGEGYNVIINRLNSIDNVTLLMANKVFLMENAKMLSNFQQAITKHFLSEVQLVNFAKQAEAARTINSWVETQTRDKIKDLIQPDDLNALTRLVLVNAIYFKGDWKHKFDKDLTRNEPFYLNDNDHVEVPMMHITREYFYKNDESLDAQILELPYLNEALSMIIILPNKRNGIGDLEKKLESLTLADVTKGMYSTKVNVALPRFKVETTINLEEPLAKLGLAEMFDQEKANFKGMIELQPNENLYVSKVIQKAFIEVNEEGAEAAAATAMIMVMCCSLPEPDPEFIADHPFIYTIASSARDALFYGRMTSFSDKQ